jgi:urease accessory protein
MLYLELPLLKRMMTAWAREDDKTIQHWGEYLLASRETAELRLEESNRARAFYQILSSLDDTVHDSDITLFKTQLACFSYACQSWKISFDRAAFGLLWSWLENLVLSAVKIIPLGQTDGQTLIFRLSSLIPQLVDQANNIADDDIGASSMALAIASAQHESQYSRLFRS